MSFYAKIYHTLCESKKQQKNEYGKNSNLHKHHIIPKHSGGNDEEYNFTYLTIREHRIAHFLLWKIHGKVNDLRAMYMLGANLTSEHRKKLGKWCLENKIGFFSESFDKETKQSWRLKGIETQQKNKVGIYDPKNFKKHASIGGKASIISPNNPWSYWASEEGRKKRASLGGKSHKGKKAMYKPGDSTFIRVSLEEVSKYEDLGYIFGSPIINSMKGKKTGKISPRRKKVTDGNIVYDSVHDAAEKNNITPSAIVHRCKSKKSNWKYFCDNEF